MTQNTRRFAWVLICLAVLFATAALPALGQVSQTAKTTHGPNAQEPQQSATGTPSKVQPALPVVVLQHAVPWRDPNASGPTGFAAPAGAHLSYFGGPIISKVQVIQVLYGSGSYNSQVAGASSPTMGNFFADFTGSGSGLVNLLTQYNTTISGGTNQTFGFGTFGGLFQIVPSAANNGSTISDSQIQSELLSQISAGHLPAPVLDAAGNPNTLYMIYFPPGKKITLGSSSSCVAGGFCAYHGTTSNLLNGKHVLYGVLPDLQPGSGCATGCGSSTTFGNYTSVTSHELVEAMTDADVGIATTFASPLAWYDQNFNGEIGDLCNGQQSSYTANGTTYTVQLEFSNSANNCVLPPPPSNPDFSLSASPSSLFMPPGDPRSSTITVNPVNGFTGSVSLSVSVPSPIEAFFGTNPTTSTSTVTFISNTSQSGTVIATITGTSGTLTHTTSITLTLKGGIIP